MSAATPPTTGNPYRDAVLALAASSPVPPSGYKARLIIQMVLCGILFVLTSTYFALAIRDLRRRGKSYALVRLVSVAGGRIIVLNAALLYALFNAVLAILLALAKKKQWTGFFSDLNQKDLVMWTTVQWVPAGIAGWAYTFSNLSAAASVWRHSRGRSRGVEASSRWHVIVHNTLCISSILTWVCTILPLGIVLNGKFNVLLADSLAILADLAATADRFDADPTNVTKADDDRIALESATVAADTAHYKRQFTALVTIGSTFAVTFALAAVLSMRFVWTLRKQTRDNRTRTAGGFSNITVTKQQHTVVEADNGDIMVSDSSMPAAETQRGDTEVTFNVPSIPTNRLTAGTTTFNNDGPSRNHTASNGTHMRQHSDAVALARLASDLSLSVPLIAVIAIFFVVAGVLGLLKSGVSPEWSWTELFLDSFAWVQLVTNISISSYFLYNLVLEPGRYGQTDSSHDKSSAKSKPPRILPRRLNLSSASLHSSRAPPSHAEMPVELRVIDYDAGSGKDTEMGYEDPSEKKAHF